MPITIFISYRREDSAGHAGRLFDRLRQHFGKDCVFLDVVGIDAGVDFVETIDQAVGSCDVLLAVIGREWLTCCDKQNRRRLDDPNDFIRTEISSALKRNVRVVPVLVEGAEMPPTDALPEDLQRLTRRQAVELRDSRWDSDVDALITALERDAARTGAGGLPKPAPPPAPSGPVEPEAGRKKTLLWGIAAVALLVAAGVAVSFWQPWKQEQVDSGIQSSGQTPEPSPEPVSETPATPEPEEATGTPPRDDRPPELEVQTVQTPDLIGLSLQAAIDRLRAAGLVVGDQEARQTAETPARQVLSQWPPPGKELDEGSRVDLVYAEPLPDSRIAVPDVIGAQYREALKTLLDAGFKVTRRTEPSQAAENTVVRQEPASGSRAERGARITLTYAVPVVTGIEVPDLVGKDVRDAKDILQNAGLDLAARKPEPSKEAKNTVLRQEPAAGKRVEKGTQVTLVYAVPLEDRPPETVARTIVYIWYNDEAERTTAEKLAIHLRGLQLPGAVFRFGLARRRLQPGKLFYASRTTQGGQASTIASQSGDFLSKVTGREVRIQIVLDPDVAESGLILTLPKL